jgi:integrase/recombinase XerD
MSPLRQALENYLTIRRALGFKLERHGRLLPQFVAHLERVGADTITTEHALRWATLPSAASPVWWADRLSVVRGFARYLQTIDPACELPPADLLPARGSRRATPYLYSDRDIAALLVAAGALRPPLRAATMQTLIGLLAVTGMRVGEAIRLDRGDLDLEHARLVVRHSKFGKSRELALHATTCAALRGYLRRRGELLPQPETPALLISPTGKRLRYVAVGRTFRQLVAHVGLTPRSASCRPTLHGLRHTFAVRTVLDAYRTGADVHARLALLCTYLGHADPGATYWYLSAAPELLALAAARLEQHLAERRS